MNDKSPSNQDTSEALRRIKQKAKDIRKKATVPPVDPDEPEGRLSGGPDSLDIPPPKNDNERKSTTS